MSELLDNNDRSNTHLHSLPLETPLKYQQKFQFDFYIILFSKASPTRTKVIKRDNSKNDECRWVSGNQLCRFKKREIKKYCIQERIEAVDTHINRNKHLENKKVTLKNMTAEMENKRFGRGENLKKENKNIKMWRSNIQKKENKGRKSNGIQYDFQEQEEFPKCFKEDN